MAVLANSVNSTQPFRKISFMTIFPHFAGVWKRILSPISGNFSTSDRMDETNFSKRGEHNRFSSLHRFPVKLFPVGCAQDNGKPPLLALIPLTSFETSRFFHDSRVRHLHIYGFHTKVVEIGCTELES